MVSSSERFREIVEELEPGIHQWLPVEFVDKKGVHLADRYYFIPCNRLDSADHEQTTMILYKGGIWLTASSIKSVNPEYRLHNDLPNDKGRLVFGNKKVSSIHGCRDKHIGTDHLLLSDERAAALQTESFSGLNLRKAYSV